MSVCSLPQTSSISSRTPLSPPSTTSSSPSPPFLKVSPFYFPFWLAHPSRPVTTRTTSLSTVSHPSFALRFSDLADTERACIEDDEQRAARTIDWIGDRITKQSPHWLNELDSHPDRYSTRTPWWDELSRCAEGDHVPSKYDGWNHPLSSQSHYPSSHPSLTALPVILAVSTTAPNPLQAITALHSRVLEFPSWVDTTHLLYTLIVHPRGSPLSDEEYVIPPRSAAASSHLFLGPEPYSMPSRSNMVCMRSSFPYPFHHPHLLLSRFLPSRLVCHHLPLKIGRMVPHLPVPIPQRP